MPLYSAPAPAGLLTIRRPSPASTLRPAGRDLIRACPPPRAAPPCLVRNPAITQSEHHPATPEMLATNVMRAIDKHRSIDLSARYVLAVMIGARRGPVSERKLRRESFADRQRRA